MQKWEKSDIKEAFDKGYKDYSTPNLPCYYCSKELRAAWLDGWNTHRLENKKAG